MYIVQFSFIALIQSLNPNSSTSRQILHTQAYSMAKISFQPLFCVHRFHQPDVAYLVAALLKLTTPLSLSMAAVQLL